MRIAFAANPALGHVLPLVPLALAARDAGHDVALLGGAAIGPVAAAHGLRHVELGLPHLDAMFEAIDLGEATGPRRTLRVWSEGFAWVIARPLAHGLLALAESWRPDLVVHDDSEQGTWIAAERLDIPHVALQATAWRGTMVRASAASAGRLREELGLPPDPGLTTWHRHGFLATRPPSLVDPSDPLPAGWRPIRPEAIEDPGASDAPWLEEPPGGGLRIAVTLGTVAPPRRAPLLATILDGLAPLDAEIVAALGPGLDPALFLPRPSNVRLVSFVPMARLLPRSDLVVCHAGSGTMLAALAAGRPMVVLPMAADQPQNAAACAAAGVASVLERDAWTAPAIRAAVTRALGNPGLAAAAARLRSEIEAMPPAALVVPDLEALAASPGRA